MKILLDLEVEYNNRARVPEHPAHIAGWTRDGAAYRAAHGGVFDLPYGERPRQTLDLFEAGPDAPIALYIHGGYWQALDKSQFSHMAAGPNAHGVSVAVMNYTLCPDVTLEALISEVHDAVRFLARRFARPATVYGHSAGGHLAALMLASDWSRSRKELGFDPVVGGMGLSGLYDLVPLVPTSVNVKLGLDAATARALSPLSWQQPTGKRFAAVVGGAESPEYLRQSAGLLANWQGAGVEITMDVVEGADHFTIIAPLADPLSDLTRDLVAIARRA